ncbi:MAG: hypothetical protein NT001_01385, partial [Candidatus Woesearchaeota archaeon]|nr:hypothetical protein [Candidatus Woesearchaeota archaeon]
AEEALTEEEIGTEDIIEGLETGQRGGRTEARQEATITEAMTEEKREGPGTDILYYLFYI